MTNALSATGIAVQPAVYYTYFNEKLVKDQEYLRDAELRQQFGHHDMMFLRFEYTDTYNNVNRVKVFPSGTPVRVLWGQSPDLNQWYGYVNDYKLNSDADSGSRHLQLTYTCIGTSQVLNPDKTRTWGQVTPTYIAKKIAKENGFRCVVTSVDWVLPYEVQAGESDFRFLNRIADKTGMRFWCSGGTLYLIDPAVAIYGSSKIAVPKYQHDKFAYQQDTLRSLELQNGTNLPGTVVSNRKLHGIDKYSGQLFTAVTKPGQTTDIDYVNDFRQVSNYHEAKKITNAWSNVSQHFTGTQAEVFGNTLLYPGKLVNFQGRVLMDNSKGYWLTTRAVHVIKASGLTYSVLDRFLTQVDVMRNIPEADVKLKGVQPVQPEMVKCVLGGKKWKSTNTSVVIDGVRQ